MSHIWDGRWHKASCTTIVKGLMPRCFIYGNGETDSCRRHFVLECGRRQYVDMKQNWQRVLRYQIHARRNVRSGLCRKERFPLKAKPRCHHVPGKASNRCVEVADGIVIAHPLCGDAVLCS